MFRYVFYDFDGTVFDTVEGITRSARYAINKQGIDAPLDELRCFAGPPLYDMFMEKFGMDGEHAQKACDDFVERYLPIGVHECRLFPGIREHISAVRQAGIKTGIATAKPLSLALMLLEEENIRDLFDTVQGSRFEGRNDPKWEILQNAMNELGADREQCVLVGDTKWDVLGAHRIGVKCIAVRYGYAAEGELEAAGADYIVSDLTELEKLLIG